MEIFINFHCLLPVWPGKRCLNHLCIKKQQNHLRRFFLPYIPASIPSGPQYSLTSFPQCWHLISRTVHSVSVPSSSKMRRLHLGLGHLIISICHRLLYSTPASNRPYFPPPRTDMEQGNQPVPAGSLLSFVLYWFLFLKILLISPGSPQIQKFIRLRGISCKIIPVYPMCCLIQTTFSQIYFRFG